mgnify:CR=1 FL=1
MSDLWPLRPRVDFLNHGSFGSCPRPVRAAQDRWRERMEARPIDFLDGELSGRLRAAASRLAAFLGASGRDLVFVDNATAGANAVLRSFPWRAGDEVVLADHAYPAVMNAARHLASGAGAKVRLARVPFAPQSPAEVTAAFEAALTPRTRLAVVDHVTSPTGLIFPVKEIVRLSRRRGIKVLVDGAHAPGMLDLDIPALGADWYTGNLHKWLCAPKGSAFLWASKAGQRGLHPAVISNNYGKGFLEEFDWCGTKDPSPWLSVTAALDFHKRLGGAKLRRRNRALALAMGTRLARAWGAELAPASMLGSMAALALPLKGRASLAAAERLHDALRRRGVEVPVFFRLGRLFLRISAAAYNRPGDYDRLERLVPGLLRG